MAGGVPGCLSICSFALPTLRRGDSAPQGSGVIRARCSGEPKGALHTQNTMYASASSVGEVHDFGRDDVRFTPHALMHIVGQDIARAALVAGASTVQLDAWSGERGLQVLADSGTTGLVSAPAFVYDMIAATGGKPPHLPALRTVRCVGTTIPKPLVSQVSAVFGARLLSGWGMTEIGVGAVTRSDDPADWAAYSDGRPVRGVELDLRSDTEITRDRPGRLFVRGGTVCLATVGRDSGALTAVAEHDDGWYDTGDLAVSDGRGGIRLMGRAGDRIGGVFMIPVNDVESAAAFSDGAATLLGFRPPAILLLVTAGAEGDQRVQPCPHLADRELVEPLLAQAGDDVEPNQRL
jgi:cyclohexanecarboxylate-CoA ligase